MFACHVCMYVECQRNALLHVHVVQAMHVRVTTTPTPPIRIVAIKVVIVRLIDGRMGYHNGYMM